MRCSCPDCVWQNMSLSKDLLLSGIIPAISGAVGKLYCEEENTIEETNFIQISLLSSAQATPWQF